MVLLSDFVTDVECRAQGSGFSGAVPLENADRGWKAFFVCFFCGFMVDLWKGRYNKRQNNGGSEGMS